MFRVTRSYIEMLKGYMDGESLGTPDLDDSANGVVKQAKNRVNTVPDPAKGPTKIGEM